MELFCTRLSLIIALIMLQVSSEAKARSHSECEGDICLTSEKEDSRKKEIVQPFENFKYHIHPASLEYRFKRIPPTLSSCNTSLPRTVVVQLAVFADHALYAQHVNQQRSKSQGRSVAEITRQAEEALQDFVFTSLHNAQLLLNSNPLTPRVKLVLSTFMIWKDRRSKTDQRKFRRRSLNMAYYMRMFCDYQKRLKKHSKTTWDHAMLLTGFDLTYMGKDRFSGYGTTGSICLPDSCAVIEASNFKSAYTIIHELGHALGMKHDGQENDCSPRCCVMGPVVVSGNHNWSRCSQEEFVTFLGKLRCSSRHTTWCLDQPPEDGLIDFTENRQLPGQKVPLEDQCRHHMGSCYRTFFRDDFNNLEQVCREVWCTDGNAFVNASHAALEGTYCGNNSWCRGGRCTKAPPNTLIKIDGSWSSWADIMPGKCGAKGCSQCQIRHQLRVHRQLRICNDPTPNNGGKDCNGSQYRGHLCDTEPCVGISPKAYATTVCRSIKKQRQEHPRAMQFTGEGLQNLKSKRPCIVWCKLRHTRDIYTFFDQFPDGTPCDTDKYCVGGLCMNLSCNGKQISESDRQPTHHHSCFSYKSSRHQKHHQKTTEELEATTTDSTSTKITVQPTALSIVTTLSPRISLTYQSRRKYIPKETFEISLRNNKLYNYRYNQSSNHAEKISNMKPIEKNFTLVKASIFPAKVQRPDDEDQNQTTAKYNAEFYSWTPWTPWGACSRTCGQGFKKRVRYCKNGDSNQVFRDGGGLCKGRSKKYQICFWNHCLKS